MRYLVPGGGTAAFLLFVLLLLLIDAPPVAAQGTPPADVETESFLHMIFVSGGVFTYPALLMLAAVAAATLGGVLSATRPDPWPLWPDLVHGLGDAGFLFAIVATFAGLREAMLTIARLGAAVTAADVAHGLAHACSELCLGAVVALAGLLGAALVRARTARGGAR
jgi:hypothetical protein